MQAKMVHINFNVLNLNRSLDFYKKNLGLKEERRKEGEDFTLVYLGDGQSGFQLELTWMHNRTEPYDLGEQEFHLAFVTDDFENMKKLHGEGGHICFENKNMGVYFIEDPDGYWIEIIPDRR